MKNNLKDLRERLGFSQKEMSAELNLPTTTYNNYELGCREPRSDFWVMLSDKYGVTVEYLIGRTDEPYKKAPLPRELTAEEHDLLTLFNLIPDEDKPMITNMIRAALQSRGLLTEDK